ncbi:MAG: hypothetical protein WCH76_07230, partial [Candidatus Riflemargulisbacteria bacterium]
MIKPMNRMVAFFISLIFSLAVLLLLSSCGITSNTSGDSTKFQISSPYSGFTSADIQSLSITQNLGKTRN